MSEPEQNRYEVEVIFRAHGQEDAHLHREMVTEKASTDGALSEFWRGVNDQTKSKMHPVADGR